MMMYSLTKNDLQHNFNDSKTEYIIGTMSGTSCDGIDIGLIACQRHKITSLAQYGYYPYTNTEQQIIYDAFGAKKTTKATQIADNFITQSHIDALQDFITQYCQDINITAIGFHGQTITHDPGQQFTWQIGNSQRIANALNINVIGDLRMRDIAHGGQCAPIIPIFHHALCDFINITYPAVWVNIGGIANVTIITENPNDMIAFDSGIGNALSNDVMQQYFNTPYDDGGAIALQGKCNEALLDKLCQHDYFTKPPPKSLDRLDFHNILDNMAHLSPQDQLATIAHFCAKSIILHINQYAPQSLKNIIISGGGRHNHAIMQALKYYSNNQEIINSDDIDNTLNGDAIEAYGIAYLAQLSQYGCAYSFPHTTGVKYAISGGRLYSKNAFSTEKFNILKKTY